MGRLRPWPVLPGPEHSGRAGAGMSPARVPPGHAGAGPVDGAVADPPASGLSEAMRCQLAPHFPAGFLAIWDAVARLAPGTVASYGGIARRAGLPGRARLVARALGRAPAQLHLPWHRVLRADGRIAFAPGSDDFNRQRQRLQAEGVAVSERGRVRLDEGLDGASETSLDARLWRLPPA